MKAMKTKFSIMIALIATVALIIAGCSDSSDKNSSSPSPQPSASASAAPEKPAKKDKYVIGFSQSRMNHPYRVAMGNGNKEYAEKNMPDVEFILTDAQNDSSKQVSDVEALVARGVDVLMISPISADALTPIVKQVMDKGIPVVTMDRKVNTDVTLHIGGDNYQIGKEVAKYLAEKLGGKGNIIEIQGTAGASATVDRHNGFIDGLKDYPDIKIIAEQHADYDRALGLKFMEDAIQRFGKDKIDAVYAHNDAMGLGASQALREAGITGVKIVSIDGENQTIEAVKNGTYEAVFLYPTIAPEGVQYAYKIAQGLVENIPKEIILPSQVIDASNVDSFIGKGF